MVRSSLVTLALGVALVAYATPPPGDQTRQAASGYASHRKAVVLTAYTDDPLVPGVTVIRLLHLTELRAAVDNIRQTAGLSGFDWTDPQPTLVRAIHVIELRSALAAALSKLGRSTPTWTDTIAPGGRIRAVHLQEIRDATAGIIPTQAGGSITTNTTWTANGSPYVVNSDVTVSNGATLTIGAGTIVKFQPGRSLYVLGGSTLIANGSSAKPIFLTSIKDDTAGGDTNGDGNATQPARGDWSFVGIGNQDAQGGHAAFGSLSNVVIRYGTQWNVRFSTPTLQDVTSTQMSGDGLALDTLPSNSYTISRLTLTNNAINLNLHSVPSSTTIRDSIIRGATQTAVFATSNTAANLTNNSIDDNFGSSAIYTDGSCPIVLLRNSITNNRAPNNGVNKGIDNLCCATIDAQSNWWGSTSGPELVGAAATGGGSQVNSNVQYANWLGKPWEGAFKAGDHPWTLKAGVGTDIATGNFHLVEKDLSIPTVGFPLEIIRTYNNKNSGPVINDFGAGWTWNYGTYLDTNPLNYGVVWYRDDGAATYFKRNPDDTFSSEEGIYEKLVWDAASATYRMRHKDQSLFLFSADGKLTSEIDANGNTTSISRDGSGRVIRVTEQLGRSLNFEYDAQYISRITDPLGRSISYSRAANGAIATVTKRDQYGSVFATASYSYGSSVAYMTDFSDSDGNSLSQTFDSFYLQQVSTQRYNGLATIYFSYADPAPGATTVRDTHGRRHIYYFGTVTNKVSQHYHEQANGSFVLEDQWKYVGYLPSAYTNLDGTTHYFYDWSTGNLLQLTEPGGRATTYVYDQFNNVTSRRDNLGRTSNYTYDQNQNLLKTLDAQGGITLASYYSTGLRQFGIDARGNLTAFLYDANGYPVAITNAANETSRPSYDAGGRKISETDPLGNRTVYVYDARDQVTDIADPQGFHTYFQYDAYGRKIQMMDALGRATAYQYNSHNLLWKTVDARAGVVELIYDDATGNRVAIVDANGGAVSVTYDDFNRKASETDAMGRTWRFDYVGRDRISHVVEPSSAVTSYSYDGFNQLQQVLYPDNRAATFSYDGVGNRISLCDWTGVTTWQYDSLNRAVAVSKSGQTTGYGYDAVGNLTALTYENGKTVQYAYDAANRMATVTDWNGLRTTYQYDQASRLTGYAYPNGVLASRTYDTGSRLTAITYARGSALIASFDYAYDQVGNRLWKRRTDGILESYTYDELHRLTNVYYPGGRTVSYSYDNTGNRRFRSDSLSGNLSYSYDAADEMLNDEFGSRYYDLTGQLTAQGSYRFFTWNAQHRLSQLSESGNSYFFTYDGDGRRTQQIQNGTTTDYVLNTVPANWEVLRDTINGQSTYYIYGHDLLYTIENSGPHFLYTDALGSITNGTDINGISEVTISYDAFGSINGGSWRRTTHRFTGEEQLDGGLVYLRARYYDPSTGRFISRDPLSLQLLDTQSINRYAYVKNDPILNTDPSGECPVCILAAVFGIGGAITGVAGQWTADRISGERSDFAAYAGAATGGAVNGLGMLGSMNPFIAGVLGGAASSIVREGIRYSNGARSPASDIAGRTVLDIGGNLLGGFAPETRMIGVTMGQNSYKALFGQITTKLANGTIARVGAATALKMFVGRAFDKSLIYGTIMGSGFTSFFTPTRAWSY